MGTTDECNGPVQKGIAMAKEYIFSAPNVDVVMKIIKIKSIILNTLFYYAFNIFAFATRTFVVVPFILNVLS